MQPASIVVRIAAELVVDIRELTVRANALERELAGRMNLLAPRLLALPGCGTLTAAKIVGETANASRFRSEACFAMHAGVAPIPASSGKTNRHRLARGGNRQLNAALHRIAVTQIRLAGCGRDYFHRRLTLGNTKMEALRAMKRRLARVVFNLLRPDTTSPPRPYRLRLDIGATHASPSNLERSLVDGAAPGTACRPTPRGAPPNRGCRCRLPLGAGRPTTWSSAPHWSGWRTAVAVVGRCRWRLARHGGSGAPSREAHRAGEGSGTEGSRYRIRCSRMPAPMSRRSRPVLVL